jgi:hypothetical protein
MKTSLYVSLTGHREERGRGMLPFLVPSLYTCGEEIFLVYVPVGKETSPSLREIRDRVSIAISKLAPPL